MATVLSATDSVTPMTILHPLASLRPEEVTRARDIVVQHNAGKNILWKIIAVKEPNKEAVVNFLEAEHSGRAAIPPPRIIYTNFYFQNSPNFHEALVDVTAGKVVWQRNLGSKVHAPGTPEEMERMHGVAMKSELVQNEIKRLKLIEDTEVVCEPWPYGKDGINDDERLFQCYFFLASIDPKKNHPSLNHYAHPLDFSCIVDGVTEEVIRIERLPLTSDFFSGANDDDVFVPQPDQEYATELQESLRQDFKPLHISQPQGVSFTIAPKDPEVVSWQKWRFRLTFNYREGPVLRDVRYDGRPVFYRLALAEMTVPYGDPRSPYHRKSAYDLGECGAGATANNLALGCDCLGVIKYFDGWINNEKGEPLKMENCICMHEVDAGIGWKHTNFRNGRAEVTRARELIIQTIMTIANYEYILCWVFDTAGSIHFETRATGIMSVVPMKQGAKHDIPYGLIVAPGVMAPSHQHIFSLRIDPAIDGYRDSAIQYEETVPTEPHPELNPFGVAFEVRSKTVTQSSYLDLDVATNRTVKIINDKVINPVCGKNVGYKIVMPATQLQLAHQASMHYKRGEFADHHFYFTPQNEDELYPGSDHPWQSHGGEGVRTWAARQEKLGNNGVVWAQFGFTHNPRLEDWPVMPCEVFRVHLKPTNFFTQNPALDVPASTQKFNQSKLVTGFEGVSLSTTSDSACCGSKL